MLEIRELILLPFEVILSLIIFLLDIMVLPVLAINTIPRWPLSRRHLPCFRRYEEGRDRLIAYLGIYSYSANNADREGQLQDEAATFKILKEDPAKLQRTNQSLRNKQMKTDRVTELQRELDRSTTKSNRLNKDIITSRQHIEEMRQTESQLKEYLQVAQDRCEFLDREVKRLQTEKEQLTQERNKALSRLSESLSDKLKQGNPYIADLGDENRATKLAEKFSELYDEEWTELFDVLENIDHPQKEQFILSLIMEIYHLCTETAREQHRQLVQAFTIPGADLPDQAMLTKLSEFRKTMALRIVADVKKGVMKATEEWITENQLQVLLTEDAVGNFINKGSELCWLMACQEPPVVLSTHVPENRLFDKDLYREYMCTGQYLADVIWPVMLLHLDGPILRKGVAEGLKTLPK